MKKRKDECLFCSRRKCPFRIVSLDKRHPYDEIACIDHVRQLEADSRQHLPAGVLRRHLGGSPKVRGGGLPVQLNLFQPIQLKLDLDAD